MYVTRTYKVSEQIINHQMDVRKTANDMYE